ncbi:MAG TPA: thermonuclease family protein [Nitrospira sp.]|nr:thermonuclease family protein [Nitrospira sp.]
MRRYGSSLSIAVPVFVIGATLIGACAPHRSHEVGALTMPKAHTQAQPFQVAIFHGCYDGDTCTVSLPYLPALFGDHITVRLAGIDTPEIKGICEKEKALARQAQAFTQKLMVEAQKIELLEPKRDKYFRILAKVMADGKEVAKELVGAGFAAPYNGQGKKKDWCEGT